MPTTQIQDALIAHLAQWGLRRFETDKAYFQWQRATLSPADLASLNRQVEAKHAPGAGPAEDILFYDLTAQPSIVPVLYSQRYDYYLQIGSRVAERIGDARSILDFGCGVGILTTFYARQFPTRSFLGIDRSTASIEQARRRAKEQRLTNVRFECCDLDHAPLAETSDLVIATHALLQAEQDPGLPSMSWRTFERERDPQRQQDCERRTGLRPKLDRLAAAVTPGGRLIVFEKTRQLARRVLLQRALTARGFQLLEQPEPIRYLLVEEVADDGPFYVLGSSSQPDVSTGLVWDESPEPDDAPHLDLAQLRQKTTAPDEPLYENHLASAQPAWLQLKDRSILKETARQEPDGRQFYAELGTSGGFIYLYCANTFDQRQLVVVESARAALLETYYQEITSGTQ